MVRNIWRAVAVASALALTAAACGPTTTPAGVSPTVAATAAADQPATGGRVIWGSFSDIQRLNPATSNDATSSLVQGGAGAPMIYDSLVFIDPKTAEVKPELGTWKVSADGLTFRSCVL